MDVAGSVLGEGVGDDDDVAITVDISTGLKVMVGDLIRIAIRFHHSWRLERHQPLAFRLFLGFPDRHACFL